MGILSLMLELVNILAKAIIINSYIVLNALIYPIGMSTDTFFAVFPGSDVYESIFRSLGIFILFILFFVQIYRSMFTEQALFARKDSPSKLALRFFLALLLIVYTPLIVNTILSFLSVPFTQIETTAADGVTLIPAFHAQDSDYFLNTDVEELLDQFMQTSESFWDTNDLILSSVSGLGLIAKAGITAKKVGLLAKGILKVIVMGIFFFKMIAFCLQILERYTFTMFLSLCSSLIWPFTISESTLRIFREWFSMFLSNYILLFLNIAFLRIILGSFEITGGVLTTITDSMGNTIAEISVIMNFFLYLALIRCASMMDAYLARMLHAAPMGNSFAKEIDGAGRKLTRAIRNGGRTVSRAASGSMTAAKKIGTLVKDKTTDPEQFAESKPISLSSMLPENRKIDLIDYEKIRKKIQDETSGMRGCSLKEKAEKAYGYNFISSQKLSYRPLYDLEKSPYGKRRFYELSPSEIVSLLPREQGMLEGKRQVLLKQTKPKEMARYFKGDRELDAFYAKNLKRLKKVRALSEASEVLFQEEAAAFGLSPSSLQYVKRMEDDSYSLRFSKNGHTFTLDTSAGPTGICMPDGSFVNIASDDPSLPASLSLLEAAGISRLSRKGPSVSYDPDSAALFLQSDFHSLGLDYDAVKSLCSGQVPVSVHSDPKDGSLLILDANGDALLRMGLSQSLPAPSDDFLTLRFGDGQRGKASFVPITGGKR